MPTTTRSARQEFLFDVFVTALEGGINYWATVEEYHWRLPGVAEDAPCGADEDRTGFYAVITEQETGKTYRIDASVIRRGINQLAKGACTFGGQPLSDAARTFYAKANAANEAGMLDADTADNVVQSGLFADIVYG
jgi:hypothetical protein